MDVKEPNTQPEGRQEPEREPTGDLGMIPAPADETSNELGADELGAGNLDAVEHYRTDTLADSVFILIALNGVQRLVGLCRAVLFCRWLTADQLGLWDMAFGFLMLAAPLSVLSIPAAYGRYLEHYRQRGLLRTLVRRTGAVSAISAAIACIMIFVFQSWFSELIFGSSDHADLCSTFGVCVVERGRGPFFRRPFNGHAQRPAVGRDTVCQQPVICRFWRWLIVGLARHGPRA